VFKEKEQGYALLSVLLIVVVFMIIVVSFMGHGFSSVKQNQVVEKTTQSVSLAEMGLTYYETAVQNIYAANTLTIGNQVKQKISDDRLANTLQSNDYYVKWGVSKMKDTIQTGLSLSPVTIDGRPSSSFFIDTVNYYRTPEESKILLKVKGNENGKTTLLSTEMNFSPTISGANSTNNTIPPSFNSVSEPKTTDQYYCENPTKIGTCKSILITTSPKTFTDKLNNTSNVTIYSNGVLSLDTPANANNMSFVTIHSGHNLTIDGNVQNASNVTLEVIGTLTITGQFTLLAATNVYVDGNVDITKQLTLESGSKMCVTGTVDASKIKYKGGILVEKLKETNESWITKCGTPPPVKVEWGDSVNNKVNYDY
jgi:hypothetical protein